MYTMYSSLLTLSVLHLCGAMRSGIIGGKEAKPHSHPYMVSIQMDNQHTCGGLLIEKDYVLTTAHCVDNIECPVKSKLKVVLGAHNISRNEFQQQRIPVLKCIKHPCYRKNERPNDIMLLKLQSKAKLNNAVKILKLPKKNTDLPVNQKCTIAGWGKTENNSPESSVLREVTLKVQDNKACKLLWQDYFDKDNMICTASDGSNAFCQGDSGSPLICGNEPQGLAAYTFPGDCLNLIYPQVYMKIFPFLSWIEKVIR